MSRTGFDLRRRALFHLSGQLPCVLIKVPREDGGEPLPYLERYKLLELPGGKKIYLHRFVHSDSDRGYHNHPWDSISFPLVGRYLEYIFHPVAEKRGIFKGGTFNYIPQEKFHRVELLTPDAWTLFFRRGTKNGWGFIYEDHSCEEDAWRTWIGQKVSRWIFLQGEHPTDKPGGWEGIPKGKDQDREAFRSWDRGHCL